jgi:hypothetical protein
MSKPPPRVTISNPKPGVVRLEIQVIDSGFFWEMTPDEAVEIAAAVLRVAQDARK